MYTCIKFSVCSIVMYIFKCISKCNFKGVRKGSRIGYPTIAEDHRILAWGVEHLKIFSPKLLMGSGDGTSFIYRDTGLRLR